MRSYRTNWCHSHSSLIQAEHPTSTSSRSHQGQTLDRPLLCADLLPALLAHARHSLPRAHRRLFLHHLQHHFGFQDDGSRREN
jgi:hypothetical protein